VIRNRAGWRFEADEHKTTKPPGGGLLLNCHFAKNSGAGEGIRTLDPDLGKITVTGAEK